MKNKKNAGKVICFILSAMLIFAMSFNAFAVERSESASSLSPKNDSNYVEGESDISIWEKFIDTPIEVPLAKDKEKIIYGSNPEGHTYSEGDVKEGDDDPEYNYKLFTILKQAKLYVKTLNASVVQKSSESSLKPVLSDAVATDSNGLIVEGVEPIVIPENFEPEIKEGYDYVLLGSDKYSRYYAAYVYNEPLAGPDEQPVYSDEDGNKLYAFGRAPLETYQKRNLMVPKYYLKDKTVEGTYDGKFPAVFSSIQQFTLSDKNGECMTAYCADQNTETIDGYSYYVENIEDASYYSEDEAKMIRAIAYNGYWGKDSGFGSLDSVKKLMSASGKFTQEEVDRLNDGMALTATQYAIWSFSNIMDKEVFINVYLKNTLKNSDLNGTADEEDADLIFKLYRHLATLDPVNDVPEEVQKKTIINEKNFLDKVTFKITEDPVQISEADTVNEDEENSYEIDLSFALKTELSDNDNLVIKVTNEKDEVLAEAALSNKARGIGNQIVADKNNMFTLEGIDITEGNPKIKFELYGEQKLFMAPYLFTSEVRDGETSQTLVAVAEGTRQVNVEAEYTYKFEVTAEQYKEEHNYRSEPTTEPTTTEPTTTEPATTEPSESTTTESEITQPTTEPDDDNDNPRTGDVVNIGLLTSLAIISLVTLITVLRRRTS